MTEKEFEKLFIENFFKTIKDKEVIEKYEERKLQIRKEETKQTNLSYLFLLLDIIKLGFMLVLIVSLGIFIAWTISQGIDLIKQK